MTRRCGYSIGGLVPCRAYPLHGGTRCKHHTFTRLQSQLLAIRPSAADTLECCPYRFYREYIVRDAHSTSRAARIGTVYHTITSLALKYQQELGERPPVDLLHRWLGHEQLATLTQSEAISLHYLMENYRPPEDLQTIVAVEPSATGGYAAEPSAQWMPVQLWDGFEVWGTPDLVYMDRLNQFVIHDWKTGRKPEDPSGWAPIVYAALLARHCRALTGEELRWPVRVQWHFVRYGQDGLRSRLIFPEDIDSELARLEGLVKQARGLLSRWGRKSGNPADALPAQANEFCGFCPVLYQCPLGPGQFATENVAGKYLLACARERAAKEDAEALREQLVPIIGDDQSIPHDPFQVSARITYRGQKLGKTQSLTVLLGILREHGADVGKVLSVTAPNDLALREALAEAGFLKRTIELDVRRRKTVFEEAGVPEPRPGAEVAT